VSLTVPCYFRMALSTSVKSAIGILVGITFTLFILDNLDILMVLILLIHEHDIHFKLFCLQFCNKFFILFNV
jgi:hypothetical protein